ncbi:MAG: FAD-dependent oxidoreductase [Actinomycetota bacterium]|nr:FAD-dependent oxidoreductase [Actinomycetota bacterium]
MALLDRNASLWVVTTPGTSYPRLSGNHDADVVVVGAGMTGLTTALLLAQSGASVVLVEAHRVGTGTTGYTTAKVTSLHSLIYASLIEQLGQYKARLYGQANQAAIEQIATLVGSLGIDCQFTRAPAYTYTVDPDQRWSIEAEVSAAQSLGMPASLVKDSELPYPIQAAVRFADQAHFHPRRYILGLASALEAAGGVIFEQSRAIDIDERDGAVLVQTTGGQVRAKAAVVATLLPFLDIGGYFAKAHPSRSYALSVRCAGSVPAGMYLSIDSPTRSVRPVDVDGAVGLVVEGSGHKPGQTEDTERFYTDLEAWTRDRFEVEAVDYRWSAQDYTSIDQVPYIGRCPRTNAVYVATGYNKWGMTGGTVAGMIIADLISGRNNRWLEVFDATRVGTGQAVAKFVKENASVGMHFVKDRLQRLAVGQLGDLSVGTGGMVQVDGQTVGAYRDPSDTIHAVSITCTHLGCSLKWNSAELSWDCPCHGSRFTYTGEVIEGPATQPLKQIPIEDHNQPT